MSQLEDLEVQHAPPPQPKKRPRWPWVVGIVILLALVAAGAYYLYFRPGPEAETPAPPPPPEAEVTEAPEAAAAPERQIELPPLDASDALVRELVGELSSHPQLAAWLVTDGLIQRFTVSVDNIAEGRNPRTHLLFLDPAEEFQVAGEGEEITIAPESYRRYDLAAQVFTSLDTAGTAVLYRELEPLIQEAYRDLGYPDRDFDATLAAAIRQLLATPVVEGEVEVVPRTRRYELADPELESLSPPQKQLLRMGPENVRRVQEKLRELARALDLQVEALP